MRFPGAARFTIPLGVGASLSLLVAGIGTLEDLAGQPEAYERFGYFLTAFAVTSAYLMGAFVALWAAASVASLAFRNQDAAFTLAGFLPFGFYTALAPSSGAYPIPLPWADRGPTQALILASALLGVALWLLLRRVERSQLWDRALRVSVPLALIAAASMLAVRSITYGGSALHWLLTAAVVALLATFFQVGAGWKALLPTGVLVAALVAGWLSWRDETTFERTAKIGGVTGDAPNVILITIDTLRFDSLFGPSDSRPRTPALDAFAAQSYRFQNAISSGPWTPPGMASIMTGVGPLTHGIGTTHGRLPEEIPTLADRMADAGYQVAACGLNVIVQQAGLVDRYPWSHWHPYPPFGLSFGNRFLTTRVDYYLWNPSTAQLTDWAMEWLTGNADTKFFYWLHYYDPHVPYAPPAHFMSSELQSARIGPDLDVEETEQVRTGNPTLDEDDRRWLRSLYDAEVRYVDENLERLFQRLKELDLFDESLIVITSDHGEEFFEHGGFEHGQSLYQELLHVPLMIKPPMSTSGGEISQVVATAAATPTVLDLAGIEYDEADFVYPSLGPFLDADTEEQAHTVFSAGVRFFENWYSVIFDGRYKYLRRAVTEREELYDLAADPGERNNLNDPELLERGRARMAERFEIGQKLRERYGVKDAEEGEANQNTRRLLESLGYVQ